jgi:hypothetical protein
MVGFGGAGEAQGQHRLQFRLFLVLMHKERIVSVVPGGRTEKRDFLVLQQMQE